MRSNLSFLAVICCYVLYTACSKHNSPKLECYCLICMCAVERVRYDKDTPAGKKAGTPLADGYFGVLWAIMGDLDYFSDVLGLPRSNSRNPCCLCRCTAKGPRTYTEMQEDAQWTHEIWTAAEWLAWPGRSTCPIFSLPGVSVLTVALDYMHSKYLGSDMYMYGSVLFVLVHFVMQCEDPLENLLIAWDFMKAYYKANDIPYRFRYMNKLTMFVRKKGFPKLRGTAAEIKCFGTVLLATWDNFMNSNLALHRQIRLMLKLNVHMENILSDYAHEIALPAGPAESFKRTAFQMGQVYSMVAEYFLTEEAYKLFDVTCKLHHVMHCALLAKYLSPRKVWCFTGEDMMGKDQQLAKSCVRGNSGPSAVMKMADHYSLGLHLKFEERARL